MFLSITTGYHSCFSGFIKPTNILSSIRVKIYFYHQSQILKSFTLNSHSIYSRLNEWIKQVKNNNSGSNNCKITHNLEKKRHILNYYRMLKHQTFKCKKYFIFCLYESQFNYLFKDFILNKKTLNMSQNTLNTIHKRKVERRHEIIRQVP